MRMIMAERNEICDYCGYPFDTNQIVWLNVPDGGVYCGDACHRQDVAFTAAITRDLEVE